MDLKPSPDGRPAPLEAARVADERSVPRSRDDSWNAAPESTIRGAPRGRTDDAPRGSPEARPSRRAASEPSDQRPPSPPPDGANARRGDADSIVHTPARSTRHPGRADANGTGPRSGSLAKQVHHHGERPAILAGVLRDDRPADLSQTADGVDATLVGTHAEDPSVGAPRPDTASNDRAPLRRPQVDDPPQRAAGELRPRGGQASLQAVLATLRDEPTSTEPPPRRRLLELPRAEPPRRRWPRLRALARRARASEALRDPSSPLRRAAFVIASIGGVVGAHGLGAALGDAFARDLPEPVVEQPSPPRAAPVDASTLERARSLLAHEPVDAAFLAAGLLTRADLPVTTPSPAVDLLYEALARVDGRPLDGHTAAITSLATDRAGTRVATGDERGVIVLRDLEAGGAPLELRRASVERLGFGSDGLLLVLTADGVVERIDPRRPSAALPAVALDEPARPVTAFAVRDDAPQFWTGHDDGAVCRWDLERPEVAGCRIEARHRGPVRTLVAAGERVFSLGEDGVLWRSGRRSRVLARQLAPPHALAVDATGDTWAVVDGASVRFRRAARRVRVLPVAAPIAELALTRDGETLVLRPDTDDHLLVRRLSAADDAPLIRLDGLTGRLTTLAIADDDAHVLAGSVNGRVGVWDLGSPALRRAPVRTFDLGEPVTALAATGRAVLVGGRDGTARRFAPAAAHADARGSVAVGHTAPITALARAEEHLISGSRDATAILWRVDDGDLREVAQLRGPEAPVTAVGLSPDATRTLVGTSTGDLLLYVAGDPRPRARRPAHGGAIHTLAVLQDGAVAITGGRDDVIRQWTIRSDGELIPGPEHTVEGATVITASAYLAVADERGRVLRWTPERLLAGPPVLAHERDDPLRALAFTPSGGLVWGGDRRVVDHQSADGVVRPGLSGRAFGGPITALAVHPAGHQVAVAASEGITIVEFTSNHAIPLPMPTESPQLPQVVAYTPSGDLIVAGFADGAVVAWAVDRNADAPAPRLLGRHEGPARHLIVSNTHAHSAGDEPVLRTWPLRLRGLIRRACALSDQPRAAPEASCDPP